MRTRLFLFLLLAGLALGLVAALPGSAAEKADADRINRLIEQLGSGDFAERERAYQALDALGAAALETLRKSLTSEDAEIRRRVEELVAKWEKFAERDKILKPTRLRLTFKDTPLPEALEEVRKKTGVQIYLHDPENKLAGRKVTVDTGEKTLWEAFDLFCEKAGLTDGDPLQVAPQPTDTRPGIGVIRPVPLPAPAPALPGAVLPIRPIARPLPAPAPEPAPKEEKPAPEKEEKKRLPAPAPLPQKEQPKQGAAANFLMPLLLAAMTMQQIQIEIPPVADRAPGKPGFNPYAPNQVVLVDGTTRKQPVDYAGAVRIRALADVSNLPVPRSEKEILLGLQVTPEPRLTLQGILGVTVEKAIDDQGQNLTQVMDAADGNGGNNIIIAGGGAVIIRNGRVGRYYGGAVGNQLAVRLQKGDRQTKVIKELKGSVTAQVRTAPQEMMVVENLLEAKGKKATCDGGSLEILKVTKNADGSISLDVKVETPTGVQPINPGTVNGGVAAPAVMLPIGGARRPAYAGGYNGLTVTDAKGNRLPMAVTRNAGVRVGNQAAEYTFQIVPQENHGPPEKLTYTGSSVLSVDIPFTLKDVQTP